MGMNVKHLATVARPQTLRYMVLNSSKSKIRLSSWNLTCYHGAASTCHGKKIVPFGAGLGISFSQTRASHNKPDGSGRECFTFLDETIAIASSWFKFFLSVNIEQHECCVKFWNFGGSLAHFLCINWVFNAFMCIFKIELHAHALMHINWLKIQICVLGCMIRSHPRNRNEFQTPCHRHSAANIEIPSF